jgi:hypothetical protein
MSMTLAQVHPRPRLRHHLGETATVQPHPQILGHQKHYLPVLLAADYRGRHAEGGPTRPLRVAVLPHPQQQHRFFV